MRSLICRQVARLKKQPKLLKGASSHWINQNRLVPGKFSWGRGYGAFSVSPSSLSRVITYINTQEAHHQRHTFRDEYEQFLRAYSHNPSNKTVKTVLCQSVLR